MRTSEENSFFYFTSSNQLLRKLYRPPPTGPYLQAISVLNKDISSESASGNRSTNKDTFNVQFWTFYFYFFFSSFLFSSPTFNYFRIALRILIANKNQRLHQLHLIAIKTTGKTLIMIMFL